MPRQARVLAVLLIGLGIGLGAGARFGSAAVPWAVAAGLVGIALSFVGPRVPSLVVESQGPPAVGPPRRAGLGSRTEQILRLAEAQANERRDEAKREAERILAAARVEADAIIDAARTGAAKFSGRPQPEAGTNDEHV